MFEPRFTTHGFQYVRIEGHPGPLTADDVDRRRRAHRPRARAAGSACSDERLEPAARRGGVEPPRQRLRRPDRLPDPRAGGVDRRLAAVRADGVVPLRRRRLLPEVAARPRRRPSGRTARSATWRRCRPPSGPASWPRSTARPAGATRSCWCRGSCSRSTATRRSCATRGRRWCAGSTAPSGWRRPRATPTGRRGHPEPRPHDRYLWDTGFHWGEWLVPGEDPGDFPAFVAADKGDTATAFYAWSTRHAAEIAAADRRGRGRSPLRRAERARGRRLARRSTSTTRPRRAPHAGQPGPRARASAWSPTSSASRPPTTSRRWSAPPAPTSGTGFLATPDLLPVLADHGHLDVGLRAAAPGHRAVLAGDDRPRRDDRVGALGGRRRRRRAARVAQPLLQGRGRSRSCTGTSPGCSGSSRPGAGSGWRRARAAGSPRPRPST